MVNLRDLSIMTNVVEEGSVQAASLKLHRTPASVSQALRRLEECLSLELFDRTNYRIKLTERGQAFYEQAKLLLERASSLERYARLLSTGQEESYRISVQPIIPDAIYLPKICQTANSFKDTGLHIVTDTAAGPFLRLQSGQVDLCIAASSHLQSDHQVGTEARLLGKVQTLAVIHPSLLPPEGYPAALAEWLAAIRQIVVSGTVDGDRGEYGTFGEKTLWFVSNPEMKRRLICQGFGWGRLPEPLVRQDLAEGKVASLVIPGVLEPEEFSVWAFRRANCPVGPVGDAIWQGLGAKDERVTQGPPLAG